jgi:hypothetical protein
MKNEKSVAPKTPKTEIKPAKKVPLIIRLDDESLEQAAGGDTVGAYRCPGRSTN